MVSSRSRSVHRKLYMPQASEGPALPAGSGTSANFWDELSKIEPMFAALFVEWKRSGYRRTTSPPFITKVTCSRTVMSASGSPFTAMISACFPAAIEPT